MKEHSFAPPDFIAEAAQDRVTGDRRGDLSDSRQRDRHRFCESRDQAASAKTKRRTRRKRPNVKQQCPSPGLAHGHRPLGRGVCSAVSVRAAGHSDVTLLLPSCEHIELDPARGRGSVAEAASPREPGRDRKHERQRCQSSGSSLSLKPQATPEACFVCGSTIRS
jgi:hypothetical protein